MDTPPPVPSFSETPSPVRPNSDDKLWIVLCHLSCFIGLPILIPLVVYLVKKDDAPLVADQAKEALNFHLSYLLYSIGCVALMLILIGFILLPLLLMAVAVLSIIAAIKGSEGVVYRYPLTIRFVK